MAINEKFIYDDGNNKYLILKIGKRTTIDNICNGGTIWMWPPAYFQYEFYKDNDVIQGDRLDSIWYEHRYFKNVNNSFGNVYLDFYSNDSSSRIICFYMLNIENNGLFHQPDVRIKKFGSYFTIVNINELHSSINTELKKIYKNNFFVTCNRMNYLSYKQNCSPDNFSKRDEYSYQNEIRIKVDAIEAYNEIEKNNELKEIDNNLKNLINEQEKLHIKYNNFNCDPKVFREIMDKNDQYNQKYLEYLQIKSKFKIVINNLSNCFHGIYNLDVLFKENKSIQIFNEGKNE